jgi:hypothetical protein
MQDKTNYKINYNKSIKDKEKKILEYYKRKSNLEANKNQLPKLKKRTKKYIPNTNKNINMQETDQKINDSTKLTKLATLTLTRTAKLPTPELTKPKVVEMD